MKVNWVSGRFSFLKVTLPSIPFPILLLCYPLSVIRYSVIPLSVIPLFRYPLFRYSVIRYSVIPLFRYPLFVIRYSVIRYPLSVIRYSLFDIRYSIFDILSPFSQSPPLNLPIPRNSHLQITIHSICKLSFFPHRFIIEIQVYPGKRRVFCGQDSRHNSFAVLGPIRCMIQIRLSISVPVIFDSAVSFDPVIKLGSAPYIIGKIKSCMDSKRSMSLPQGHPIDSPQWSDGLEPGSGNKHIWPGECIQIQSELEDLYHNRQCPVEMHICWDFRHLQIRLCHH